MSWEFKYHKRAKIQAAENDKANAAGSSAQDTKAGPKISSIHIQGKIRSAPQENFSSISSELDFVPINIWKLFGENPKWHIEKPKRTIVMDGDSTIMLIGIDPETNVAIKVPFATDGAFDSGPLLSMADMPNDLNGILEMDSVKGPIMNISREQDKGVGKIIVTIETKAKIDAQEESTDESLYTSKTRRIFRFDAETKMLEAIQFYLHKKDKEELILETNNIECNQAIDPAVFTLKIPENVEWYKEPPKPGKLPDNEKYAKMTLKEAAAAFFEACSNDNWDEAQKFFPMLVNNFMRKELGGLQVIKIGDPFQKNPIADGFCPMK